MQVLIAAELQVESIAALKALGLEVVVEPRLGAQELPNRLQRTSLLVVGRQRVTRRSIESAPLLQGILRAGAGVEGIDLEAASERGIAVADCGDVDACARAELALGLLIALDRGIGAPSEVSGLGLRGRILGLHGWDGSADHLAQVGRSLGMRVLVFTSNGEMTPTIATERGLHWCESEHALYARADIVSVHASREQVLVTRECINTLRDHSTLVDVSGRGHIDLFSAGERLRAGTLRLGLDGYLAHEFGDEIPFPIETRHLRATFQRASETSQVEDVTAHHVISSVQQFIATGSLPNTRNLALHRHGTLMTIRHRPGPEVVSAIFEALKDAGLQASRVESRAFQGGKATRLQLAFDAPIPREVGDEIRALAGVLDCVA